MTDRAGVLTSLERWSPRLFLIGGAFELVFAANNGLAFLLDGFSFVDWLYPTVLLGRVAVLLGIAGVSVRIADRNPRAGRWSRIVLLLALVLTAGLLTLSSLRIVGVTTPVIAVFGLGTVVMTIVTYALFGGLVLRTGVFSTATGGLLLAAAAAVLGVFVGLSVLPTRLVGGVGEGVLFVIFLAIWRRLGTESTPAGRTDPASSTVAE